MEERFSHWSIALSAITIVAQLYTLILMRRDVYRTHGYDLAESQTLSTTYNERANVV